jgi:putative permease
VDAIKDWFGRYLSDPQVVFLLLVLTFGFAGVLFFGRMLTPVIAGVIVAYLLEGLVAELQRIKMPRHIAVAVVFLLFIGILLALILILAPLLWRQITQLAQELPTMYGSVQREIHTLALSVLSFLPRAQVEDILHSFYAELDPVAFGQNTVTYILSSIPGVITLMVYLILLPVLVFLFLKDKQKIMDWGLSYLPENHQLVALVWREMSVQIGNYVRGKSLEIIIVGSITYVTFTIMELRFAALLAMLVGLSVVVPYIGAVVVTVPVAIVAFSQWGFGPEFTYILIAYLVIQALDGNLLVPIMFSEVVNLHPVAIIVAVLLFGGVWGFWGVFFAIPLATLVRAVISALPRGVQAAAAQLPEPAAPVMNEGPSEF